MPARIARWLIFGAAGFALVWVLGRVAGGAIPTVLSWLRDLGPLAPLAYLATYTLSTVALVPGSLLTLAAGALFGLAGGTIYAFLGATLGAAAAFTVARHLLRDTVARRVAGSPRFTRLDRAIGRNGLRIVFLLRLSPLFPFTLLNYLLGASRVRFKDYLLASVGMIPGTVLYVYYGKVAGDVALLAAGAAVPRDAGYYALLGLGLVATLAVTAVITRIARRALAQEEVDGAVAGA